MFTYPSSEMIGDSRRYTWMWNLESPIDHGLINDHSDDIETHKRINKKAINKSATFASEPDAEIMLD